MSTATTTTIERREYTLIDAYRYIEDDTPLLDGKWRSEDGNTIRCVVPLGLIEVTA